MNIIKRALAVTTIFLSVTVAIAVLPSSPALAFFHNAVPVCDAPKVKKFAPQNIKSNYFAGTLRSVTKKIKSQTRASKELILQLRNPMTLERRKAEMEKVHNARVEMVARFGKKECAEQYRKEQKFRSIGSVWCHSPADKDFFYGHHEGKIPSVSEFNKAFADSDMAKLALMNQKAGLSPDNIDPELYEKVRTRNLWGKYGYEDRRGVVADFVELDKRYEYFRKLNPVVHNREIQKQAKDHVQNGNLLQATSEYIKNATLSLESINTLGVLNDGKARVCAGVIAVTHAEPIQVCGHFEEECDGGREFTSANLTYRKRLEYILLEPTEGGDFGFRTDLENPYGINSKGIAVVLLK